MLDRIRAIFQRKTVAQRSGNHSTNYQAEKIIIRETGLTVADAKEVALMVVEQNFIKFSEQATAKARARMEEMVNDYLAGIAAKDEALINEVQEPGVQMALVTAQKEYVKTGDKDLGELLVNVLIERTAQPERNLLQITLDESLLVIGKLTEQHVSIMLLSFVIHNVRKRNIVSLTTLNNMLRKYIAPLMASLSTKEAPYMHIASCNCGDIMFPSQSIAETLIKTYPAMFSKGFSRVDFITRFGGDALLNNQNYPGLIIPCLHNMFKLQIGAMDEDSIDAMARQFNLDEQLIISLKNLFNESLMTIEEVKTYLRATGNYMGRLLDMWETDEVGNPGNLFSHLTLNHIGKAIAIAAYKKHFGETLDYSIWIND